MSAATRIATMRAAVLEAPGRFGVATVPKPEPEDGELLVRIEGCGVCASSLPLWEGREWFDYPIEPGAPGHEAWGRLDDGTRVAVLTERGFAELAAVPEEHVVELPPGLDGMPFAGEPLACAVNAFHRGRVARGQTVAIVGMGFLGRAIAQLARSAEAEVVEVRRDTPTEEWADRCERVFECAGTQEALDTASRLVSTRGLLAIVGYHQDGLRQVDVQSWNWRGLDVVNAHERDPKAYVEGIRAAARLAAEGVLDVETLLTHELPLDRLGDAFELARTRPEGFVKAWVRP